MKYFVYVIKSLEGYHYTGFTEDIDKRIIEP
jgi:predicted GIY-YIG superfamily endonuclease